MEYAVLGPLQVVDHARDVTPPGQRARDLLSVLLLRRGQSVEARTLLDLVWGEAARSLDVSAVHTVVARLRRALGEDAVETTGTGYRVPAPRTDAILFEEHLARGLHLRAGHPSRTEETAVQLRAALSLWRDRPPFDGVSPHLVAPERRRLESLRATALEALAESLLELDPDEAVRLAEVLVSEEPLRERGHELVMLAHYRAGRQAEALTGYRRLVDLLREELGVDPGPGAVEVHRRILAQDPTLTLRATGSPVAAPAPVLAAAPLVGRGPELARARELLASRRLVVVTGPGGVGKTRLLTELYQLAMTDSPDRVAFLDLAVTEPVDAAELAEALGRTLGLTLAPGQAVASLVRLLATRELALFVDEAERSWSAVVEVIAPLVASCPLLSVVVASRRPLELLGEAALLLAPLAVPEADADGEALAASPAVRLLRDRMRDRAPDLSLGEPELPALGRIARAVDGLPLALELVAAQAATRSLADLEQLISSPLDLASSTGTDLRGRPARHRTLRDTLAWSIDRLPPERLTVWQRLGVLAGAFDIATATAVVGGEIDDVESHVHSLVRDALVQVQRRSGRLELRLLRTVRELALAALTDSGDLGATRSRHRAWFAGRWAGAMRSDELLHDVFDHHEDYRAALRSALAERDAATLADLTITVCRLWVFTDALGPGLRWTARALDSGLLDELEEARVRIMRATLVLHQDPALARTELRLARPILEASDERPWLVTAGIVSALERYEAGDTVTAVRDATGAVGIATRSTDERRADALGVLAVVAAASDPLASHEACRRAWSLARASRSGAAMASVANNVSLSLLQLGREAEALEVLETSRTEWGMSVLPLFLHGSLGWALLRSGDCEQALVHFEFVAHALGDVAAERQSCDAYAGAACALVGLGDPLGEEVVLGVIELLERVDLTLMPFQVQALREAAGRVDGAHAPDQASTTELGVRMAWLISRARQRRGA